MTSETPHPTSTTPDVTALVERSKKAVSTILGGILSKAARYTLLHANGETYIRWGAVERDINEIVATALRDAHEARERAEGIARAGFHEKHAALWAEARAAEAEVARLTAALAEATRAREAMRGALEPFGRASLVCFQGYPDDTPIGLGVEACREDSFYTLGDLRRAYAQAIRALTPATVREGRRGEGMGACPTGTACSPSAEPPSASHRPSGASPASRGSPCNREEIVEAIQEQLYADGRTGIVKLSEDIADAVMPLVGAVR